MAGFIVKQPNGLYCRFSLVTDCPSHWNMTRDEYIELRMQKAKEDAIDILDNHLRPFDEVIENFIPNNMTDEQFEKFLKETSCRTPGGDVCKCGQPAAPQQHRKRE